MKSIWTASDLADCKPVCLMLDIEELGRDVAAELETKLMTPLLLEEQQERLMAWQLGVNL